MSEQLCPRDLAILECGGMAIPPTRGGVNLLPPPLPANQRGYHVIPPKHDGGHSRTESRRRHNWLRQRSLERSDWRHTVNDRQHGNCQWRSDCDTRGCVELSRQVDYFPTCRCTRRRLRRLDPRSLPFLKRERDFIAISTPYPIHHSILGTVYLPGTEGEQMPDIDIETLIRQRAEFLRKHPRIGDDGIPFFRDFVRSFDKPLLAQLNAFDGGGWIVRDCLSLFGYAGDERQRKRLQRGLKRLVADGTIERSGRSGYRFKIAEHSAV